MNTALIALATVAALLTSTISGVIGMAGGAMLLVLLLSFGMSAATVIPLHAAVQLASNASRVIAFLPHVRWRPFAAMAITASPFPLLGLWLISLLNPDHVQVVIGCFILVAVWLPSWRVQKLSEPIAFAIAGVLGGTLGVVIGTVGPLIAPFFLRPSFNRHQIIATKAICQSYLHILKIIAFSTVGFSFGEQWPILLPMIVAAICGTYVGRWFVGRITEKRFRQAYRIALSLLALKLISTAVIS